MNGALERAQGALGALDRAQDALERAQEQIAVLRENLHNMNLNPNLGEDEVAGVGGAEGVNVNIDEIMDRLRDQLAVFTEQMDARDPDDLKKAVAKQNYARVQELLQVNNKDINCPMTFCSHQFTAPSIDRTPLRVSITGLEFAAWQGDWQMSALLFVKGADPDSNVFDGGIETAQSYFGLEPRKTLDGFDAEDPRPVKGFAGLKLLVNGEQNEEVGNAYLCIMECLHRGSVSLPDQYHNLAGCIDVVSTDLRYSASDLKSFVLECLQCLTRAGLSNDAALLVVESAVLTTLWSLLESFATRGLTA